MLKNTYLNWIMGIVKGIIHINSRWCVPKKYPYFIFAAPFLVVIISNLLLLLLIFIEANLTLANAIIQILILISPLPAVFLIISSKLSCISKCILAIIAYIFLGIVTLTVTAVVPLVVYSLYS